MDAIAQDIRYAFRHLRQSPGFAIAAILTLALGVGANTAMFTMLNTLVLRPLAIHDPAGLIGVDSVNAQNQRRLTLITAVTELERDGPLRDLCGFNGGGVFAVEANGAPTQGVIGLVTGKCFATFGVQPLLGRTIADEDAPISARGQMVTVISHRFWTRMFGADPNAIGKTIRMEGVELTVIGVMPPGFGGIQADSAVDFFVPNYTVTPMRPERPSGASHLLGRLKPGVTLESARAQLEARWPSLLQTIAPPTLVEPERSDFTSARARVERLTTGLSFSRERYARPLTIISGLTVTLLVLACLNLGGLLLSRLSARGAELGIRLALGGSGGRIAQQMLIESLMLSLIGAGLAIPTSFAFVGLLTASLPAGLVEPTLSFSPDTNVLAATAASGVAAGIMMSALPIWLAWRRRGSLTFGWDRTIAGSTNRWARGLLVTQVALSVIMLTGAGLLVRSLYLLLHVDPGVRTERVLNIRIMPLPNAYRTIDNASYFPALLDEVRSLPGVRSAGVARVFPRMINDFVGQPMALVDEPARVVRAQLETASPGFFETVGIPLKQGRLPAWTDHSKSLQVAVISESLAALLDPAGNVIGRHVKFGTGRADQDVEIVGVVGNASLGNPRHTEIPVFYRPTLQAGLFANYPNLVVATDEDPLAVAPAIEQILKRGGREYAHQITTVDRAFAQSPSTERMSATLAGAVAVLAVMLAFIGIYGLLAYAVSRRTREIGVRVALGADRSQVVGMVMREGLVLTAIGMAIGLPTAVFAARLLRSLMFGVSETDPLVLGATTLFFLSLGLVAGIVPARRAAGVDPAVALRIE
jgi:predicted permease